MMSENPFIREGQCTVITIPSTCDPQIDYVDVADVKDADAVRLLQLERGVDTENEALPGAREQNNLNVLMPSLATRFELKSELFERLKFKLWHPNRRGLGTSTSYLALSYRWLWTIADTDTPDIPLSPALFQAFINERQPNEGLWCDQICIAQGEED
jgi:hypothetical protein